MYKCAAAYFTFYLVHSSEEQLRVGFWWFLLFQVGLSKRVIFCLGPITSMLKIIMHL